MEEMRNAYKIWVRKPEMKRPLGRHRHRWEDDIRLAPKVVVCEGMKSIQLSHDKFQWQAL
jgi:hypothetical protein